MAEQPGESKRDESNTNNTIGRAADIVAAGSCQALRAQLQGSTKARRGKKREAGSATGESTDRSAGAGSLQAVQAGLGSDRGAHSECAGHAVCLSVLPEVAPRSGARQGI
ncbi:MAG TPA: hypothetical protein VMI32_09195 [Candidatus Solibacter sp.]|nr:hypothetical protein [Candidatus Solibacter sp.]